MSMEIDVNLQLAGCRFINKQLSKLMRHLEGIKTAGDTEDVHQARVACRRLRSAFDFFGDDFEGQRLTTFGERIKKLTKSLGTVRDIDVQIEFLKEVLADIDSEHKKVRPGVKRILLRWGQRRQAAQAKIIKVVDKIQKKHMLTDIHLEVERILFERQEAQPDLTPSMVMGRIVERLQNRVADVLSQKRSLGRPEDSAGHHALRISIKKLRYEMEISDIVLRGRLKNSIKKVKKIQTILGYLQDCVVWESDIADFIEQEKQRTVEYYGYGRPFAGILRGLEFLRQERKNQHDKLFVEATNYLAQLDREHFWEAFLEPLRSDNVSEEPSEDEVEAEKDGGQIVPNDSDSI